MMTAPHFLRCSLNRVTPPVESASGISVSEANNPSTTRQRFDSGPLTDGFHAITRGYRHLWTWNPTCGSLTIHSKTHPPRNFERSEHRRQGGGGFWRKGRCGSRIRHERHPAPDRSDRLSHDHQPRLVKTLPSFLYVPLSDRTHTRHGCPMKSMPDGAKAGHYGDFVAMVDTTVGLILDCLERSPVPSMDTIVIFTSDNGAHWPDHGCHHLRSCSQPPSGVDRRPTSTRVDTGFPSSSAGRGRIASRLDLHRNTICLTDVLPHPCSGSRGPELPEGRGTGRREPSSGPSGDRRSRRSTTGESSITPVTACSRFGRVVGSSSKDEVPVASPRPARIDVSDGEVGVQLYDLDADPTESVEPRASELPDEVTRLRSLLERDPLFSTKCQAFWVMVFRAGSASISKQEDR